jgi:hypothetical protein
MKPPCCDTSQLDFDRCLDIRLRTLNYRMILCPNCGKENGDLAVVCLRCGGFLQARIVTLDLFTTVWQIIEAPTTAMRRIVLAAHKNYALILSSLFGIHLSFSFIKILRLGEEFENLLYVIFAALLTGVPLGLLFMGLLTTVGVLTGRVFTVQFKWQGVLGVASYATIPIILTLIFVLPVELMTFGLYFFGTNPSPFVIKPLPSILFSLLDGGAIIWSIVLFVTGIRTMSGLRPLKALAVVLISVSTALVVCLEVAKLLT